MSSKKKVYRYPEPRVPFYPEKEPLNRRVYRGVKQALGGCLRGVGELIAGLLDALSPLIGGLLSIAVFLGIFFGLLSLCTSRESTQPAGAPAASAVHGAQPGEDPSWRAYRGEGDPPEYGLKDAAAGEPRERYQRKE
ncbi:hypothetical protein [Burkholderia pyrrocinia]|uniref:hypothetical protein n=1 Tax=Burkholderia pyrrocinia TaxID=60550 RepID=UPI00104F1F9A|nr:hypothetical protein [Burkholderia pyrrocinia]TDA43633.1 hypothetical protein EVG18_30955 [Burkholderia pyrrocinia]